MLQGFAPPFDPQGEAIGCFRNEDATARRRPARGRCRWRGRRRARRRQTRVVLGEVDLRGAGLGAYLIDTQKKAVRGSYLT